MNEVASVVGLDLIQLSGDERASLLSELSRPAIGTLRVHSSGQVNEEARFREWIASEPRPWAVLIDSHVKGMYGGTGTVADWFLAADFAGRYPVILAGGLSPDNVALAIQRVHPFAVDVSSGVETGGRKDVVKIRAFVAAAKAAANATRATVREEPSSLSS
jgi:phosphoribosylanthranilate isomerase